MERNENPESRRHERDDARARPRRRRLYDDEDAVSSADWEPPDWSTTPAGRRGEPSPHVKPGGKTWVEAEEERRARGEPPRHSLPGEPKLPHEIYTPPPPKRTGTGFFYKSGDEIPPTHPDHGPMHLLPRQEDGSFASYYYCSKEELDDFGLDRPPPRRHRQDGLTPERIETFIRTLRATASVSDAARAAGCSRQAFYDLYNRPDAQAFRDAWDLALRGTNIVLTSTAYDRAVNGVEEKVFYKGEFVGHRTRYDNRLLMWLLRVRDPLNFAPLDDLQGWLRHRDVEPHAPIDPALDRLAAAEEQWGNRLPGETAPPRLPGLPVLPEVPEEDEPTPPKNGSGPEAGG